MSAPFRFSGKYDTAQVEPWLEAFSAVHAEITAAGSYPYNDSFRGRIPGIEGPDEDRAIYLLQTLRQLREEAAREAAAVADGYTVPVLTAEPQRFAHVIHIGRYSGGTGWSELRDVRLAVTDSGTPFYLAKGARTRGRYLMGGRLLAKVTS